MLYSYSYKVLILLYINKEISSETEHLQEKLEEGDPMDNQDLWGNFCNAQQGFELVFRQEFKQEKRIIGKRISHQILLLKCGLNHYNHLILFLINELNFEVIIDGQIVQFNIDENDEYNPINQPYIKVNYWNHICLSYEQSASVLYLDIAATYQFSIQELEITSDFYKNKKLILGSTTQEPDNKYNIIKCMITEFRFWKQKFQLEEVQITITYSS